MANKRNATRSTTNTKKVSKPEAVEAVNEEVVEPVKEEAAEKPVVEEASKEVEEKVPIRRFAKVSGVKAGLRLRNRPSTESDVLGVLKLGQDHIEILENLGEWTKVQVKATVGYVMTEFIEEV